MHSPFVRYDFSCIPHLQLISLGMRRNFRLWIQSALEEHEIKWCRKHRKTDPAVALHRRAFRCARLGRDPYGSENPGTIPDVVGDICTAHQEHGGTAPLRRTSDECRRSRRPRRLGQHSIFLIETRNRTEHLIFADQHNIIDQLSDRPNAFWFRRPRRQSIGTR